MRPWFSVRRAVEAVTPEQLWATGSLVGSWGTDPVDGDIGYTRAGAIGREVPEWTREKAVAYSVHAYRANPMARAIIDTCTAFAVGDSGVTLLCSSPQVEAVAREFWEDPRNDLDALQDLLLRDQLLTGETLLEMLVGQRTGVVRFSPIMPSLIETVELEAGNPLWPARLVLESGRTLDVVRYSDQAQLRQGEVMFWTLHKALLTDQRGMPFLSPLLDQLDQYDNVVSNLMDRTALARYLVWDVTVKGSQDDVDAFVAARGGMHIPRSGTAEVHNESVEWKPVTAQTGAMEDSTAAALVLTEVAAGAGLSKHWLSEPEGVNRATSMSMAEPVRRRVGRVQRNWLRCDTELLRYAVDQAVAAGRLPRMVESQDPRTGVITDVPAASTVRVAGPEIAAADAQVTAQVMLNLSTGLANFVKYGIMSSEAAAIAAEKAWEQFVGVPYRHDLGSTVDDLANYLDDNTGPADGGAAPPPVPAQAGEAVHSVAGAKGAATLHHYWTRGEGAAKWVSSAHPWTSLYHHLAKFMPPGKAKRTATNWFHDVFHYYPGSDLHRVAHGKPPRGKVVGPG